MVATGSPVPSDGVVSCWMNVKKRLAWTALRTRESDVTPCTCSRDQTMSTAAVIASFVCVRTLSVVTRIESPRWCVDTAMLGRFPLSLSLVLLLVSSLSKVTPSAPLHSSSVPRVTGMSFQTATPALSLLNVSVALLSSCELRQRDGLRVSRGKLDFLGGRLKPLWCSNTLHYL